VQQNTRIYAVFNHFDTIFERPFVKRFALCYRTVICHVCLSVTLVCIVAKRLHGLGCLFVWR